MFEIIGLALTGAVTFFGYTRTRGFVRNRLRFVDAVQKSGVPILAGATAFAVALPVVGVLPFVGGFTAAALGASVGFGVAHGRNDIRFRRING